MYSLTKHQWQRRVLSLLHTLLSFIHSPQSHLVWSALYTVNCMSVHHSQHAQTITCRGNLYYTQSIYWQVRGNKSTQRSPCRHERKLCTKSELSSGLNWRTTMMSIITTELILCSNCLLFNTVLALNAFLSSSNVTCWDEHIKSTGNSTSHECGLLKTM